MPRRGGGERRALTSRADPPPNLQVTKKNFKFASANNLPFYFVSAADGTNIVKVFEAAISAGLHHKENEGDWMAEALAVVDSLQDDGEKS